MPYIKTKEKYVTSNMFKKFRTEMKYDFNTFRSEMKSDFREFKTEMRNEFKEVKSDISKIFVILASIESTLKYYGDMYQMNKESIQKLEIDLELHKNNRQIHNT